MFCSPNVEGGKKKPNKQRKKQKNKQGGHAAGLGILSILLPFVTS